MNWTWCNLRSFHGCFWKCSKLFWYKTYLTSVEDPPRRSYYQHCDYRSGFFVYHEIPNSFNSNNSSFEMIMTKTCAGVFIHNLNPYIWEFSFWTHNLPFYSAALDPFTRWRRDMIWYNMTYNVYRISSPAALDPFTRWRRKGQQCRHWEGRNELKNDTSY